MIQLQNNRPIQKQREGNAYGKPQHEFLDRGDAGLDRVWWIDPNRTSKDDDREYQRGRYHHLEDFMIKSRLNYLFSIAHLSHSLPG